MKITVPCFFCLSHFVTLVVFTFNSCLSCLIVNMKLEMYLQFEQQNLIVPHRQVCKLKYLENCSRYKNNCQNENL